ncbi:hypothetical protein R1sor_002963 [Riccia sorocarpa]|uniref:WAC domain-containing protein n=1 Tax=Riccia sorocarpa TaxID=122646 RepID=A0ABD3H4E8_9MARC
MPLLKRKPYTLNSPPRDLRPDELVFQVRFTKEIFRDYEEYLRHVTLYRKRLWTCKVTGKQNLTYEEALISEQIASEKVQQFPKEFMSPVLSMVQFSPLRTDELVDRIYKQFKDRFVVNEEALGKSGDSLCACKILKVLPHGKDNSNRYEVAWLDAEGKKYATSIEPEAKLTRKRPPFTRALLKTFIREAASCGNSRNSLWLVNSKLARKYKIPVEPPKQVESGELKESGDKVKPKVDAEVFGNGSHSTRKRRKGEEAVGGQEKKIVKKDNSLDVKTSRREVKEEKVAEKGLDRDTGREKKSAKKASIPAKVEAAAETSISGKEKAKSRKKVAAPPPPTPTPVRPPSPPPPPPPPIKYPIEDTDVKPGPDDPVFTERPFPSTDFLVPMDCVGNLLMVWDFCSSFNKALHLSPFSLEDFEKSLDYREGNAPVISETLFALVRTNLSDPVLREEFVKKRKRKAEVSVNTLKDDVSDLLELINRDKMSKYVPTIRHGNYKQIEVYEKLEILQELVDRSLGSSIIRSQLEENIEEQQVLAAKKRGQVAEDSKIKKQLKSSSDGGTAGVAAEANGNSRDGAHMDVDEGTVSGDEKGGVKQEQNGQAIGWKTKGKRKSGSNHSPTSGTIQPRKEEEQESKALSKSQSAVSKGKESMKLGEDQETGREGPGDIKKTYQKRKSSVQTEPASDKSTQDHMLAESHKKQEQLDRELEKRSIRTSSLGKDRERNVYWFFNREGRLFVEDKHSTRWGYYSAKEELDALLSSLNPKGVRERQLQKQLQKHYLKISQALTRRSKEIAQRVAGEEINVRRSLRVRTAPRLTGFLAYENKQRHA